MYYTGTDLNRYRDEYNRISEELKKGNKIAAFTDKDASAPFFESISGFNPEAIEKETATRELLAKEGMEALSGSITLVQYYKRKGYPVKFTPTSEEIIAMKQNFSKAPEVIVSSWKINGRNFRQIDVNVTAELRKLQNKSAWNGEVKETPKEILVIDQSDFNVSFNPPYGWKKIPYTENDHYRKIVFADRSDFDLRRREQSPGAGFIMAGKIRILNDRKKLGEERQLRFYKKHR